MEKYSRYIKEKYNQELLESEHGFITYKIVDNKCYIETMYVQPEFRGRGEAWDLERMVIDKVKDKADLLICEIDSLSANPTEPICIFAHAGFKIAGTRDNHIIMFKELK